MIDFKSIVCVFYDFDGVMTDNRCLINQEGTESVFVNRGDGYAISKIRDLGILQVIISTEENPVVKRRAEKLKIPVIHSVKDKGKEILRYSEKNNICLGKSLFIGNDVNDLPAFNVVGFTGAPADAEEEILLIADWVSQKKGGYGVIRDLYRQMIL